MVDDALRYGLVSPNGVALDGPIAGYAMVRDFGAGVVVGTDQAGNAVSGIKIYVRNKVIQTAFPFQP